MLKWHPCQLKTKLVLTIHLKSHQTSARWKLGFPVSICVLCVQQHRTSGCMVVHKIKAATEKVKNFIRLRISEEIASSNPTTLALKLMDAFFTKNELAAGCCTEVNGRELLQLDIIDGIQSRLLTSYFLFLSQFIPTISF